MIPNPGCFASQTPSGMILLWLFLLLAIARPVRATQLFGSGGSGNSGITPPAGDIGGTASAPTVIAIHRKVTLVVHSQSPYSMAAGDSYLDCNAASGNVTLNLPAASGSGRVLTFKDTGASGTCTVAPNGSDTIDGASSLVVSTQYQPVNLVDAASGKWDVAALNVVAGTGISTSTANGVTTVTVSVSGGSCTNQYATGLNATGTLTCSTDTLASAAHANQGTTTTVLHGNASGNPAWSAVNLATDVTGTLPAGNGGTGTASALSYYQTGCNPSQAQTAEANQTQIYGFTIPAPGVSWSKIGIYIQTADASHYSDIGVYGPCTPGSSCSLAGDTGATEFASSGIKDLAFITNASCTGSGTPSACCSGSGTGTCPSAPQTSLAGLYFLAFTSTATTFQIVNCNAAAGIYNYYAYYGNQAATSGGVLASSITAPSSASSAPTSNLTTVELGP